LAGRASDRLILSAQGDVLDVAALRSMLNSARSPAAALVLSRFSPAPSMHIGSPQIAALLGYRSKTL
jgi:hypothetical protein